MKKTKTTVKSVKKVTKKTVSKKAVKKNCWLKDKMVLLKSFLAKSWRKIVVVLGVVGLLIYFKSLVIVGFANNRPLWREEFNREVKRQVGAQVVDTMATKSLIKQEAKKQGVSVAPEEIDKELARLEELASSQEMTLDELLKLQGLDRNQLVEEINLQKMLEKMVGGDVEVTQEELDQAIETNKDFLPAKATQEEMESMVKEQLVQQKLSTMMQTWIKDLKDKSKIVSWL